ncbi:MAG: TIGR00730 family Rossman fold protein [Elusimicrobiaceae bacterium]|nr:TIGR00730 family Rossman fold protein [Elusimicrobiaceae bacterium]
MAQKIINHPNSYIKAYEDVELLKHDIMRPVRMELEVLKPELYFKHFNITDTIVCFGSARIGDKKAALQKVKLAEKALKQNPSSKKLQHRLEEAKGLASLSHYYEEARRFAQIVVKKSKKRFAVVTGGGPGMMEAANRGAFETGGTSIGLNITLPHEQFPNNYISPNMAFLFHYFAIRKIHFVMRSKAFVVFPGGFGTFDELFEILTLVQTGKKTRIPVILVGKEFWNNVVNINALARYGVISHEDAKAVPIVETAEEAWKEIEKFYKK